MDNKRQATPTAKGYVLQGYFGMYFFFKDKNYKEIDWIKIESPKEDIEIQYYDNSKDFVQVKTKEKPTESINFATSPFKKGILTLYEAFDWAFENNIEVRRLILANNMFNQGIKRLDEKLRLGTEENFIYNLKNYLFEEEIESFSSKVKKEIKDILYIARIDDSYLLNTSKILPELRKVVNDLDLSSIEENIKDALKVLFVENNCDRELVIKKSQVAWSFIKNKLNQNKVYRNFTKDFEIEINEANIIDIEILAEEKEIKDILMDFSRDYEIYMFFQKEIEEFQIKNGKITSQNIREVVLQIGNKIFEQRYLYLKDIYSTEEKKVICYFFVYFLYYNNNSMKKIYDEFNIQGERDEINRINN